MLIAMAAPEGHPLGADVIEMFYYTPRGTDFLEMCDFAQGEPMFLT